MTSEKVNYLYVVMAEGLVRCTDLATFGDLRPLQIIIGGYAVVQSVEALRYKSEGSEFGSRWGNFH